MTAKMSREQNLKPLPIDETGSDKTQIGNLDELFRVDPYGAV